MRLDPSKCTPLHWACMGDLERTNEESQLVVVKMLIEAGADAKATDIYGMIPVDYAMIKEWNRIIRYLAKDDSQAEVSHKTREELTLLSLLPHFVHTHCLYRLEAV